MIAVVMIGHRVGGRGGRAARFPVHAISVGAAVALHVTVTVPAISAMTWPHGALRFERTAAALVGPLPIAGLGLLRLLLPPPATGSNSRPRPRRRQGDPDKPFRRLRYGNPGQVAPAGDEDIRMISQETSRVMTLKTVASVNFHGHPFPWSPSMTGSIKTLFALSLGCWFSLLAAQQTEAPPSIELIDDRVRIADFGLEDQIVSAIDLIGPEEGSAGRNRVALAHRLQCWIDGNESCSTRDRNDRRVRAIRRFLGSAPTDRYGAVVVHFPDRTRIDIAVRRLPEPAPNDWTQSAFALRVLQDTAQAPGLASVPSRAEHFEGFVYNGPAAVRSALRRLEQRLRTPADSADAAPASDAADRRQALVRRQP